MDPVSAEARKTAAKSDDEQVADFVSFDDSPNVEALKRRRRTTSPPLVQLAIRLI